MTEIRNFMTTILVLINAANLFPGCIWRDVMTADDYSLCITHVLIFINKELVPHVHAKMTGLFTTTTPASQVFVFGFCSLKKKKKRAFISVPGDWKNKIACSVACSVWVFPPSALRRHSLSCLYLTHSSWARKSLSSHNRGKPPHSGSRSERGDRNIRLKKLRWALAVILKRATLFF